MVSTPGTMQLRGATRIAGPLREIGASALDRQIVVWAAPDPATIVLDPWAPPPATNRIAGTRTSPWPAPLAAARVAVEFRRTMATATVEPLHRVQAPDVAAIARWQARQRLLATRMLPTSLAPTPQQSLTTPARMQQPMAPLDVIRAGLRAPTLAELVQSDEQARALVAHPHHRDGSGISARLLAAVVIGVGIWLAAAVGVSTLF